MNTEQKMLPCSLEEPSASSHSPGRLTRCTAPVTKKQKVFWTLPRAYFRDRPLVVRTRLWLKSCFGGWLARFGYVLRRVEPAVPPSSTEYLRTVASAGWTLICFDSDLDTQTEVRSVFAVSKVVFANPMWQGNDGEPAAAAALPHRPAGPFAALIDRGQFPTAGLFEKLPWLLAAQLILLRARPGPFWSGECDLDALQKEFWQGGFRFLDALDFSFGAIPRAPAGRMLLVFQNASRSTVATMRQTYRRHEALACLSTPLVHPRDFQLLAGPGSFGFMGGIYNPGAVKEGEHTRLLCRQERRLWAELKHSEAAFFDSAPPLLLTLEKSKEWQAVELSGLQIPAPGLHRSEDFRMFRLGEQVYSNHTVISRLHASSPSGRLRLHELQTRVGLSRVDFETNSLEWYGVPKVDQTLARTEKNWGFFGDSSTAYLLYSFSPYTLLRATNWSGLEFVTVLREPLLLPFGGDGLPLRNSINPVDYDAQHWLHIVHKVYPDKQYIFWAALIDKSSLRPVFVSAKPLVCGWQSAPASIVYICAALCGTDEILLFGGVNDCSTGSWRLARATLDRHWISLPNSF